MYSQEWVRPDVPACGRCAHGADSHIHDSPLFCVFCALSPLAHAMGIGCGLYTPRTVPYAGARCREPRCECAGYHPDSRQPGGATVQEVLRGGGRQ
jgi:hypothetical protein